MTTLVAEVRARLAAATAGEWRARVAVWPSSPAWVVEVELPCINGLSAWFTLANLFTPEREEEAWTEGAIDRESARANAELMAASKADLAALADRVEELEAALTEIATFDSSGYSRWPSIITAMRKIAARALG